LIIDPSLGFVDEASPVGDDQFVTVLPLLGLVLVPWDENVLFDRMVEL
jgi:hypothetical protein